MFVTGRRAQGGEARKENLLELHASVTDRIRRLQGVVWDRFGVKRLVTRVECVCRVRRAWDSIIVDPDISHGSVGRVATRGLWAASWRAIHCVRGSRFSTVARAFGLDRWRHGGGWRAGMISVDGVIDAWPTGTPRRQRTCSLVAALVARDEWRLRRLGGAGSPAATSL